ncbi:MULTISPECIES: SMP-30/gluconolactonase/LRE family protein [unclassified Chelatococcus]|uniref:SMP-30/gluconolactonase/LRE family protein n=1 Tax=unclassified Chelatococcus TaxID=2638111 RepID=UPI001BCB9E33|nr:MULTISPECIES: SMP-30/gluconolactonase/LRE family protein [unclassified Chelatococcus]MBS7700488.1 SMP-30/gluconolactonase/LRE family protein [Chelatococcus sp. YT9]MBX3556284.1 SMP-30/gluconolactonase/LRE family protein [Chelatococcus sp.]
MSSLAQHGRTAMAAHDDLALTASTAVEVICSNLAFPEGPAFAPDGSLWWVELQGGCLSTITPEDVRRYQVGGHPNGLTFDCAGGAWFCDAGMRAIRRLDLAAGTARTLASRGRGEPLNKPNDLAFDSRGTLVFTCPGDSRTEPTGSIWAYHDGIEPEPVADNLYFPNGLALADDGRSLVVAETYRHRLWKGEWDPENLRWINPRPWAEIGGPTGPDGMALGADGLLYVAVFGQGCIKAVDPTGTIVAVYATPGSRPTNCAFDPTGERGLVVTEAERGEVLSYPGLGRGATLFDGCRP